VKRKAARTTKPKARHKPEKKKSRR